MSLVSARAIVLQSFAYGDTSKILRLLTEEHGVRSAIAKGAHRPKSRYGGVLEPFTEGVAHLYLKEGRDLQTLGGFDLIRSRQSLGTSVAAFAGASLLAEMILRSGTEEASPELFDALVGALDEIAAAARGPEAAVEPPVLAGVWSILALLGFRPELEHCVGCGRPLDWEAPVRFDVEGGGVACLFCRPVGRTVPAEARRELAAMLAGETPPGFADRSLHRSLVRAFLATHLGQERPLRSLPLLLQQLDR
jgi:DNA repair protein RecO (recombination protein O)